MSLTRAILIVSWCLSLAAIHAVAAYVLGYLMQRFTNGPSLPPAGYLMAGAAVSALTAVLAVLAIVYVKALWGVMLLGIISGGMYLYAYAVHAVPFSVFVPLVIAAQLLFSRFAIGLNAIDNPGKPRLHPSEEF
ncbi:hypothetical protein [Hyphomonas sp.]|uniref:hypothetical protein n=1 Tax=Hyphomonas sp. TaxID=87 RepID=UPI0039192C70